MEWTGNQIHADRPYQGCNNLRAGIAIAAVALFGWSVGRAQTASSPAPVAGLEEIVVTAEKRSESLQSVPLSITALEQRRAHSAQYCESQ